jgi:hypothetical protein
MCDLDGIKMALNNDQDQAHQLHSVYMRSTSGRMGREGPRSIAYGASSTIFGARSTSSSRVAVIGPPIDKEPATCMCANRILVQDGVYDSFTERLAETAGAMKVADGFEPGAVIGPLIDVKAVEKVGARIADAVKKYKVVTGSDRPAGQHSCEPTVNVSAVPVAMSSVGSRRARSTARRGSPGIFAKIRGWRARSTRRRSPGMPERRAGGRQTPM